MKAPVPLRPSKSGRPLSSKFKGGMNQIGKRLSPP